MGKFSELAKQGVYYQPLENTQAQQDEQGDFSRGFKKSMLQIPQTLGGAAALAGDLVGSDGLRDYGLGVYQNNSDKIEAISKDSDSLTNVLEGDASGVDWAQNAAGYVGGQALTAIATGGVGGFIGKQLALRGIKSVAERAIESQIARNVVANVARRGTIIGAGAALGANNLAQEAGSIYPEAVAQAQLEGRTLTAGDKARVVGSAVAAAGVDTAMDALMAGRVLNGARRAGEGVVKAGMREIPGGMAREAVTEGIQTGIERYGAGQDLSTADAIRDYVDSMGVGAVGGGMGGAAAVLRSQKVPDAGPLSRAANTAIDQQILQLAHDPQPLVSFPDGSVGHKQDVEAYLSQFTDPDERTRKRRELMGRDPETGKRPPPPPEPEFVSSEEAERRNVTGWSSRHEPVTLDYAHKLLAAPAMKGKSMMAVPHPGGGGYTVMPSNWLTIDTQAKLADLQKPVKDDAKAQPKEKNDDALPAPVDLGAGSSADAVQPGQAVAERSGATGQVPDGKAQADALPVGQGNLDLVHADPAADAKPALTTITNPKGQPFLTEFSAKRKLKEVADTHELVKVADGWVLEPKKAAQIDAAAPRRDEGGIAGENLPGARESLEHTLRTNPDIRRENGSFTPPPWTELPNGFAHRQYVVGGTATQEIRAPKNGSVKPPVLRRGLQLDGNTFGEREATGHLGDVFSGAAFADFDDYFKKSATAPQIESKPVVSSTQKADSDIDAAANEAATSPNNDLSEPTAAQAQAGNYRLGHAKISGLDISVENPAGSVRSDKANTPPKWKTDMQDHYGYFKGVPARASDKDHVDVFVKPGTPDDFTGNAYIVDQNNADGSFDEPKVVLGAESLDDARATYLRNYEKGWSKRVRGIREVSMGDLKALLQDEQVFTKPQPTGEAIAEPVKDASTAQTEPQPGQAQPARAAKPELAPAQPSAEAPAVAAEPVSKKPKALVERDRKIAERQAEPKKEPATKAKPAALQKRDDKVKARQQAAEPAADPAAEDDTLRANVGRTVEVFKRPAAGRDRASVLESGADGLVIDAVLLEEKTQSVIRDGKIGSDFLLTSALLDKVDDLLHVPNDTRVFGQAANSSNVQPATVKRRINGMRSDAQLFRNLVENKTFREKGFSGLNVETQRAVLAAVLRSSQNLKVLDSVIKLIPVDVVNMLATQQLTPEMVFHDPAMLGRAISEDLHPNIALGANMSKAFVRALALTRAIEYAGLAGPDLDGLADQGGPAIGAKNSSHAKDNTRHDNSTQAVFEQELPKRIKDGATVAAVLDYIATASPSEEHRELAKSLQALGLKTKIQYGSDGSAKTFSVPGVSMANARGAYSQAKDIAYLYQPEDAAVTVLHELVHAATLKALAKGGLAAQQIKSLWHHVKALPNFQDEYGIVNDEEFIAEAYTNPRFRQLLADTPAPQGKLSLWQKLVGIVRILLGKPAIADNVLERVMAAGPGLMAENRDSAEPSPDAREKGSGLNGGRRQFGVADDPLSANEGGTAVISKVEAVRAVGRVAQRLHPGLGLSMNLVDSFHDLPSEAVEDGTNLGFANIARGVVHDGTIYVIRDKHSTVDEIETTVLHELFGHAGIEVLFGDQIEQKLNELYDAIGGEAGFRAIEAKHTRNLDKYRAAYRDLPSVERNAILMDELFAHIAEKGSSLGQKAREIIGMIRNWLRSHGFLQLAKYGATDLAHILKQASRALETGTLPNGDRVMYSLSDDGDLRASTAGATLAQQITSGIDAATLREVPRVIGNRMADFRGIGLQALGRRQLVDIYAPDFAEAGKESLLSRYSKLMQQMDADKNEAGAEADSIADRWGNLKDGAALADLMHDATLAQIDPDQDYVTGDNRAQWAGLKGRLNALSPEAKAVFRDARDAYDTHWKKVRSEIRGRISRALPDSPRRAALLEKMDATFYEKVKGVYFPLARFGDYVVTVAGKDGARESVSFAETMNEAEALRRELLKKFPADKGYTVSKVTKKKAFNAARDSVSRGFMQELFGVLDQYDSGGQLQEDINQLYLASMPDLSWAKHGIHRKGTPGFSQDARRAFAQNMFHGARYLSKLRYADRLADHLTEMQDHVDSKASDAAYDSVKAQQVVDEMTKRHDNYMNPNGNALSSTLTSLGFIFYLGLSPASAAVNLSQTPLVTLPMLAAKYGFGKASSALLEASRQAAANRNDISKALTGDELKAYQEAVNAGVIDVSMAHDLAGISAGDDTKAHGKLRPVMKWASWMFHHGEKFNRQATLVAAYRLARDAGQNHAAAYESAVNEVYASHFDYSNSNRPRIMQGNVAKVALLFKQYGQNMTYALTRNAVLAAKGDKVALKTFAGLLLSHSMAAGVLGMPVVGTLLAAASLLGSDDDEPWDAKVALRNYIADLIGQKPAEVMMHGLSRLGPWDISGRVGLDKLLLPDVQEGLEGARAAESWMTAALGPVAGIGLSAAKGLHTAAGGDYLRGLEEMLPTSIKNPLKAVRFATQGVKDKTGIPILDDTTAMEELGQMIGFSPSRSREATEGKGAVYQAEHKLNDRRSALIEQWAHARMAGDNEGAQELRTEITVFNSKNPTRQITGGQLQQSLRNRNKRIREAEGGIYLPKKHRDVQELGRFAQQD